SDRFSLPKHDVAAVILANSDEGGRILNAFGRRLLEVLFDGKLEAEENVTVAARNMKSAVMKERSRLAIPADRAAADKLASRYTNASLGEIAVVRAGAETRFDFGEWKSAVASRKNDDGTTSLVTIVPGFSGLSFVIGDKNGRRTLTFRDAQHQYLFAEKK